jgi:hypothetical protein
MRAQNMPYILGSLALFAYDAYRNESSRSPPYLARLGVALSLPLMLAVAQVAIVNRWMTGSWRHTPYSFGDGAFKSLDFAHPNVAAVLFHPWHGLLAYHPVYAIAFAALVWLLFGGVTSTRERLAYGGIGVAVLINLYAQAAYFCWWLGTFTFGMRGLAVAAVPLVPILVRALERLGTRPKVRLATLTIVTIASMWSALLLYQGQQEQFYSYRELFGAQVRELASLEFAVPAAALLVLFFALRRKGVTAIHATGCMLVGGFAAYIAWSAVFSPLMAPPVVSEIYGLIVSTLVGIAAAIFAARRPPASSASISLPVSGIGLLRPGLALMSAAFVVETALFARAAVGTERWIARKVPPPHYLLRATANLDDTEEAYEEYLKVPGFEREKARMLEYLVATGAHEQFGSPPNPR